jgi:hypothetical protein
MKTDACQNVSNAKKAQTVVQNALKESIAAIGPAKNVETKLNARHANKDSNWIQTLTFVFASSHVFHHSVFNVIKLHKHVCCVRQATSPTNK